MSVCKRTKALQAPFQQRRSGSLVSLEPAAALFKHNIRALPSRPRLRCW